jgi:hypothetical protein
MTLHRRLIIGDSVRFVRVVYILRLFAGGGVHRTPTIIWCCFCARIKPNSLHKLERATRTQRCVIDLTQATRITLTYQIRGGTNQIQF